MIKFENEQLAKYIMFKLDKEDNNFTEEELEKVDELVLDPININGEYEEVDLDKISYFTNVKRILFINLTISEKNIKELIKFKALESIYFEKCNFENENIINTINIKEIEFINCTIVDYSFLYEMDELKSLSVVNGIIDMTEINNLKKLEYLQLSYSTIINVDNMELTNLKELHIDNTNIYDVSIISNLPNLEKISISKEQFLENKEYYNNLIKNGISVFNENIVMFEEESN